MNEGKWLKQEPKIKNCGLSLFRCSCCGNFVSVVEDSPVEDISEYKYCFNCGAKMGVEK